MAFFKVFCFFALLHVSLLGGEFRLSSSYLSSQTSSKSKAILKDYERFMNETSLKPLPIKLEAVNFYVNAFVGAYDEQTYKQDEYWASRGEFLSHGGGDCEDYVITKFYTLKDLGVDAKKMGLCVVKDNDRGLWHMVLLVFTNAKEEPFVLDNLSFKVLPLSKRYDIAIKECMNEEGSVKLHNNTFVPDTSRKPFKAFNAMMERSKKELLWQR
jgi:predicted transglutaminase-like cysteine proteinase